MFYEISNFWVMNNNSSILSHDKGVLYFLTFDVVYFLKKEHELFWYRLCPKAFSTTTSSPFFDFLASHIIWRFSPLLFLFRLIFTHTYVASTCLDVQLIIPYRTVVLIFWNLLMKAIPWSTEHPAPSAMRLTWDLIVRSLRRVEVSGAPTYLLTIECQSAYREGMDKKYHRMYNNVWELRSPKSPLLFFANKIIKLKIVKKKFYEVDEEIDEEIEA